MLKIWNNADAIIIRRRARRREIWVICPIEDDSIKFYQRSFFHSRMPSTPVTHSRREHKDTTSSVHTKMMMMMTMTALFVGLLLLYVSRSVALEEVCQEAAAAACRKGDVIVQEQKISCVSPDFQLEPDTALSFPPMAITRDG